MVDSAQYRTKVYLDTYFNDANQIHEDDGVTHATITIARDWPNYSITRVFLDKTVDLIVSIGEASSKSVVDSDHYPIGYEESVSITLAAIDKVGAVTGIELLDKASAELRRVVETYPFPAAGALTLRRISGAKPATTRIGSIYLFSVEYTLHYKRDVT